ncbi:vitamin B12 transporter [Chitinophaga polysaccharea]|uniref:Vitamin B12 transporter n=1 Tax=Chitinophaga polysaccharea TaxID=1293035 RepID=A0A561PAY6_9BACT|nr:TonB-dependent receptor [Chitinophaga polysaccharea]TWF35304.1 vitamin B12 transporter [Chitinophaga polysaccharea]
MKKEKSKITALLAGSAALLFAQCVSAQQRDTLSKSLKEVVVAATRSEKDPKDIGRSITLISSEQIANSGANRMAELLSQQEGIFVVGTGQNPGQLQSIFTRGANSNQTIILVDGVKITDPTSTDNAADLSELSLMNIERIEIVRGSQSTLYGSSAIGGVINIITKTQQAPGLHIDAEAKAGTFGAGTFLSGENVFLNYTAKSGFYINAGASNTNVNGLDATVDTVTNVNDYKHNHRDRDGFSKLDLVGKVGFKNEKWDIFASYKNVNQRADLDKGAYTDDDNYTSRFKRNLTTYGAAYTINNKLKVAYTGGLTDLKRVFVDDSSVINTAGQYDGNYYTGTYKGLVSNNELQVNLQLKGFSAVIGGGLSDEKMTFSTYYYSNNNGVYESKSDLDSLHIHVKTINQFAHIDLDGSIINDRYKAFAIGLGIRNTRHDLFGNNLTYQINPSFKVSEHALLFASYSTGFNAPSLYQLYSPEKDPTSGITRGNKTLKPEVSQSWEFGFKQQVDDHISYSISYFKTVVTNSIDYVYLWDKTKKTDALGYMDYHGDTYLNIGKQTNQGIEISIRSKMSSKLTVFANLSLISGKLEYNPSSIDTAHTQGSQVQLFSNGAFINKEVENIGLVRRPSTANAGLIYQPGEKISLGMNLKYVGPRSDIYYNSASGPFGALATKGVGDYSLLDVLVKYNVISSLSTTLRVENIFDVKYSEIYGYTTRGRGFYLSLRYHL